jgi:formate dehydrogenase subunit gamma
VTKKLSGQPSVADVLDAVPADERLILPCLQRIQNAFGFVPDDALDPLAEFLNVSRAEVVGVLTYYHDLRRTPPPAVTIGVCVAEACQAQGVRSLIGEIDSAAIEYAKVYCFGNCALGPAVMVNGRLIGRCDMATLRTAIATAAQAQEATP